MTEMAKKAFYVAPEFGVMETVDAIVMSDVVKQDIEWGDGEL